MQKMRGPDDIQPGLLPSGRRRPEDGSIDKEHNAGVISVLDDCSAGLRVLLTDRDVVVCVVAENRSADATQVQVMTSTLVTRRPQKSIDHAIAAMERRQVRRIARGGRQRAYGRHHCTGRHRRPHGGAGDNGRGRRRNLIVRRRS